MRSASANFFPKLANLCVIIGLASLAAITLVDRGATRMYAWPWSALYEAAQITPLLALVLRALVPDDAFQFPPRAWSMLWVGIGVTAELAALFSPFRGSSLLYATIPLSAAATCFLIYDWLSQNRPLRSRQLSATAALASGAIILTSLAYLAYNLAGLPHTDSFFRTLFEYRNPHPLGHPSYTAGLALVTLPWLYLAIHRHQGLASIASVAGTALALFVLLSTGSRGGLFGLGALVFAGLVVARLGWKKWIALGVIGLAAVFIIAIVNPRTRAMFAPGDSLAAPNISNVQRSAMFKAGWLMGEQRPVLGWGPGSTPLAYPIFRHELDGGVETALQLHDTPIQIWAETGLVGSLIATFILILLGIEFWRFMKAPAIDETTGGSPSPTPIAVSSLRATAIVTLVGYAVFALTDYQLDVPFFSFAVAVCLAVFAPSAEPENSPSRQKFAGLATLGAFALIVLFGKADPTPALNTRALRDANDPAKQAEAIRLLNASLAINPLQELPHFNLGWLLLGNDPKSAEGHFAMAAQLVPDKGGVYFGLGLARALQNNTAGAARAFAVECINDPMFLTSPEWNPEEMHPLQQATRGQITVLLTQLQSRYPIDRWPGSEVSYVSTLFNWLWQQGSISKIKASAVTPERRAFFATDPTLPAFAQSPIKTYHRERSGYPVLMRNLDIPIPVDLYPVRESVLAADTLRYLFPAKGWLPSPVLLQLLGTDAAHP